jgi:hypothetical protein
VRMDEGAGPASAWADEGRGGGVEGIDRAGRGDGRGVDRTAARERRASTGPTTGGACHRQAQAVEEDLADDRRVPTWPGRRRTWGIGLTGVEEAGGGVPGRDCAGRQQALWPRAVAVGGGAAGEGRRRRAHRSGSRGKEERGRAGLAVVCRRERQGRARTVLFS